jgi:hypothetical protein
MSKFQKLLGRMRNNPAGDWDIEDIERVCNHVPGVIFTLPTRGDHYTVAHPKVGVILTIPARRPVKAIYVKAFISMIYGIMGEASGTEEPAGPVAAE